MHAFEHDDSVGYDQTSDLQCRLTCILLKLFLSETWNIQCLSYLSLITRIQYRNSEHFDNMHNPQFHMVSDVIAELHLKPFKRAQRFYFTLDFLYKLQPLLSKRSSQHRFYISFEEPFGFYVFLYFCEQTVWLHLLRFQVRRNTDKTFQMAKHSL